MSIIINPPEVISSLSDKAKLFASIDDKSHLLPDFLRLTEHNLRNIFSKENSLAIVSVEDSTQL